MLNHGGLTLIAPKYMKLASMLTSTCHQEMIENLMYAIVGESFTIARDVLSNNKHLGDTFDVARKDQEFSPSMEDEIDRIYKFLVVKTLHAKFGSELKKVREHSVGHCAKNSSKGSLRNDLLNDNKRKMKDVGVRLKKEEGKHKKLKSEDRC